MSARALRVNSVPWIASTFHIPPFFFLKGWAKVSQVLILRNFGLDLWHRGGVSYFDKCRSSLRTASVPLLSWIKGVMAFQWPERSNNYILVIANPSLCLHLWLKLCACNARHLSPKKQLLWLSLFVALISCFHTSVCEICWSSKTNFSFKIKDHHMKGCSLTNDSESCKLCCCVSCKWKFTKNIWTLSKDPFGSLLQWRNKQQWNYKAHFTCWNVLQNSSQVVMALIH